MIRYFRAQFFFCYSTAVTLDSETELLPIHAFVFTHVDVKTVYIVNGVIRARRKAAYVSFDIMGKSFSRIEQNPRTCQGKYVIVTVIPAINNCTTTLLIRRNKFLC